MVRLGENAIYVLGKQDVVIRIARSHLRLDRAQRELCMARWLQKENVPAVQVHEDFDQPIVVEGYPVTFWKRIHEAAPKPDHDDLAVLLARFHALTDPPCSLPEFQPLVHVESRIANARGVSEADKDFLARHHKALEEQYAKLSFALPLGPIHGDAWIGNLMRDTGQVRLLDFEMTGFGPREWDLLPTAIAQSRYGLPKERYRSFCEIYGFDVTQWGGYKTLRGVRELTMTTWLMQNIGESAEIADEFQLRLKSIRDQDLDSRWHAF